MRVALFLLLFGSAAIAQTQRAVVVTATHGFRHESIANAERFFAELATRSGWYSVEFAREDADLARLLSAAALRDVKLVVFANTTGELPLPDPNALIDWVRNGGSFIGVHSASDTFHDFAPYIDMLGGEFDFHPDQTSVPVHVEDRGHPASAALASPFPLFEEFYVFKNFQPDAVRVLLALHEDPGSRAPGFFPLAWHRSFGAGRVFYTALGHREDVWESAYFREHLTGAVAWALAPGSSKRRRAVSK